MIKVGKICKVYWTHDKHESEMGASLHFFGKVVGSKKVEISTGNTVIALIIEPTTEEDISIEKDIICRDYYKVLMKPGKYRYFTRFIAKSRKTHTGVNLNRITRIKGHPGQTEITETHIIVH